MSIGHCRRRTVSTSSCRQPPKMAANLFRRQFLAKNTGPSLRRAFSNSARTLQATPAPENEKHSLDYHSVEDLHHLTAEEILRETGTRKDATMRHFTGAFVSYDTDRPHLTGNESRVILRSHSELWVSIPNFGISSSKSSF